MCYDHFVLDPSRIFSVDRETIHDIIGHQRYPADYRGVHGGSRDDHVCKIGDCDYIECLSRNASFEQNVHTLMRSSSKTQM